MLMLNFEEIVIIVRTRRLKVKTFIFPH